MTLALHRSRVTLPAWASSDLVGDHPPDPETWTCPVCPTGPLWPCPPARIHAAGLAQTTPMAGLVWLRWCATTATPVLKEHRDVIWARTVGWYILLVDRVEAYVGNRGPRWRIRG